MALKAIVFIGFCQHFYLNLFLNSLYIYINSIYVCMHKCVSVCKFPYRFVSELIICVDNNVFTYCHLVGAISLSLFTPKTSNTRKYFVYFPCMLGVGGWLYILVQISFYQCLTFRCRRHSRLSGVCVTKAVFFVSNFTCVFVVFLTMTRFIALFPHALTNNLLS